MPDLLVSVRNAVEARAALAGGAGLIDVKEPARGPLGPAAPEVWRECLAAVAGRRPVSVALGELAEADDALFAALAQAAPGVSFAKLGLAGLAGDPRWAQRWEERLRAFPPGVAPVAAAYADRQAARSPPPREVLAVGQGLGCRAFLLDTWDKTRGTLLDCLAPQELAELAEAARAAGLLVVLAGSLGREHLPRLAGLPCDLVGVRGAACRGGRSGTVSPDLVAELAAAAAGPCCARAP